MSWTEREERRARLVEIFADTEQRCASDPALVEAIGASVHETRFFGASQWPNPLAGARARRDGEVRVVEGTTFGILPALERRHPGARICVLNFASPVQPGGGVRNGSIAQEECLCRCSTLYPVLDQPRLWDAYYQPNRDAGNPLATDALIYTPGIVVFKSDVRYPAPMPRENWRTVDVITCAAPNLREHPGNRHNPQAGKAVRISADQLRDLHVSRARHILAVAAAEGMDVMVLGAFGCGAFQNDPWVVAGALRQVADEYREGFDAIDFVVPAGRNLEVFQRVFG